MTMNVDAEVRAANRRVQILIDTRAREALARIDKRWPSLTTPVIEPPANPIEAWGQVLRALNDGMVALAESFARGWTAVDRAQPPALPTRARSTP